MDGLLKSTLLCILHRVCLVFSPHSRIAESKRNTEHHTNEDEAVCWFSPDVDFIVVLDDARGGIFAQCRWWLCWRECGELPSSELTGFSSSVTVFDERVAEFSLGFRSMHHDSAGRR